MRYARSRTMHDELVNIVYLFLISKSIKTHDHGGSRDHIVKGEKLTLKTGEKIYPDIINYNRRLVYEIHVRGLRKEKYFDLLPDGWKGINVFYDEDDNPEAMIIKKNRSKIGKITWSDIPTIEQDIKDHIEKEKKSGW